MKKKIAKSAGKSALWMLLFSISPQLSAQISEGGIPPGFLRNLSDANLTKATLTLDSRKKVESARGEDPALDAAGEPMRVSMIMPVSLSFAQDAVMETLPTGERIYRLSVISKGALALSAYYDQFSIPEGGKLFLYNKEKNMALGAFTHATNPDTERFATDLVAGDQIIFEYVSAPGSTETPDIRISRIAHYYRGISTSSTMADDDSGFCMVNIACSEGNNWRDEQKGVVTMLLPTMSAGYLCSGSVVNNTAVDYKPFILTAFHCINKVGLKYDEAIFRFHYQMRECSRFSPTNGIDPMKTKSIVGSKLLSDMPINGGTDGALLLLKNEIPLAYDVFYNGWSIEETLPASGVAIHHPGGNPMKISTYTGGAVSAQWITEDSKGTVDAHIKLEFAKTPNGTSQTAGGSSGCPFFNEEKLIVGTLTGGNSVCGAGGDNYFGKLSRHWRFGEDAAKRMDLYLDPLNKQVTKLAGTYKVTDGLMEQKENARHFFLYPNVLSPGEDLLFHSDYPEDKLQQCTLYITDLSGRVIRSIAAPDNTTRITMHHNRGIYILSLVMNGSTLYEEKMMVK